MTRQIFVYDEATDSLIPKAEAVAKKQIYVIGDLKEPVQSMISGEQFSSKGNLRRHYKDNGVREVGNDCFTDKAWNTGRSESERTE